MTTAATAPSQTPSAPPLTVCYPINYLGFGGAERQLVELAKGLDKDRFRALVVTLYPGGPLEDELKAEPGVVLHTLDRATRYDFWPIVGLARLLRQHDAQIVQPFLSPATLFGMSAALAARTPVRIVTERCGLRQNRRLGNKLYRFAEDRLSHYADVVVPNSRAGRQYVLRRGISLQKTRIIYNGINQKRLQADPAQVARIRRELAPPPGGLVLINVASLTGPKDQATLLKAVASVLPEAPDLRVALVGDGHLRSELETLARTLGLESKVVFFGYQHRVADFLAASDVAVLSSRDNEGCSNFLLEAMSMGKPAIATNVGGNMEVVKPGSNGLLVPVGDYRAMARAILEMRADAEKRAAMGACGRSIADSRFSLGGMIEAYQDLYDELAERKLGLFRSAPKVAA